MYSDVLIFPEAVRERMHERGIDEGDVRQVISFSESTNAKLLDQQTGRFIAHQKVGRITCWVEYAPEAGGYRVYNTYIHRMEIEEVR
ncbi:MAG: hypothetical protein FWF83_04745 [Clostridiales bacterium]|nr:hypothetical protein [Clostridiales bacterium]